jgi:L-lysine exporter family protein LysE/ArgO
MRKIRLTNATEQAYLGVMNPAAAFVSGLLFSFSLIVAIGAQNAYVLRQGALREHVATVVAICAASDIVLIAAGVAGMGTVVADSPAVMTVVRAAGAALLLAYGAVAARRALVASRGSLGTAAAGASRRRVIALTLSFTWLNPAVYLDTLILLGSVASAHPGSHWWFGAGAGTASIAWFVALGFGARLLTPLLYRPRTTRVIDAFVAVVMTITALRTMPT